MQIETDRVSCLSQDGTPFATKLVNEYRRIFDTIDDGIWDGGIGSAWGELHTAVLRVGRADED